MTYRWLNVIALGAVLILNWLANAIPLGGRSTGEISAMFPVLITPATYAFAIWGVIYVFLTGFVVYQLLPSGQKQPEVQAVGPWFVISCLFNCAWVVLWHYLYIDSTVFIMFGLLITLTVVYLKTRSNTRSTAVQWLVQLPFSLYLGWISVATIVNISVVLYANDWSGWGLTNEAWTIIMLVVAAGLAVWMGSRYVDPVYIAVFVWAFVAIGASVRATANIQIGAWVLAAALFIYALTLLRKLVR